MRTAHTWTGLNSVPVRLLLWAYVNARWRHRQRHRGPAIVIILTRHIRTGPWTSLAYAHAHQSAKQGLYRLTGHVRHAVTCSPALPACPDRVGQRSVQYGTGHTALTVSPPAGPAMAHQASQVRRWANVRMAMRAMRAMRAVA